MTVGIVLVSHSRRLAEGVAELAGQMAPGVALIAVGGMAGGGLGTDYDAVYAALARAEGGDGVVVLYDLGSAKLTVELAVEALADPARIAVVDAPLVEGAVAAAVAAAGGADRVGVAAAAALGGPPGPVRDAEDPWTGVSADVELTNEVGLHARAAARLARALAQLDAEVTVRLGDQRADARSVVALLGLTARKGDTIEVRARGPQAGEAVERVRALAAANFGEAR